MRPDENRSEETRKILQKKIGLRRWMIIGGLVIGLRASLNLYSPPGTVFPVLELILALGSMGYGASLTPGIHNLSRKDDSND
ncbi:hypothetical protein ACFLXR_004494 [Salmonella enterica]